MSQEFGAGLVSREIVAMSSRAALAEGLTGAVGAAPKVAHSAGTKCCGLLVGSLSSSPPGLLHKLLE